MTLSERVDDLQHALKELTQHLVYFRNQGEFPYALIEESARCENKAGALEEHLLEVALSLSSRLIEE